MKKATRQQLANVAKAMAQIPFHGFEDGKVSNLEPIVQPFPNWTLEEADRLWCAAFVYYCCREAGFEIPIRPNECKTCHLAGCIAWEEFATGDIIKAEKALCRKQVTLYFMIGFLKTGNTIISGLSLKRAKILSSPQKGISTTDRELLNALSTGISAHISGSRMDLNMGQRDKSRQSLTGGFVWIISG